VGLTDPRAPPPEVGGLIAWERTLRRGVELVTPARVLWADYVALCAEDGFRAASPRDFMCWLRMTEGLRIVDAGKGRVRRMVLGAAPGEWRQ
jgi:hypothetical protein